MKPNGVKPLIFQAEMILSNRIHNLVYLRSTTLGCKDIEIRKSEFVVKTQFLYQTCRYKYDPFVLNCEKQIFQTNENKCLNLKF